MALLSRFFRVTGLVQGVGFRPTVYRIAIALNLKGEVFNDAQGVGIHLEGEAESLDAFEPELRRNAPTLCRIDSVCVKDVPFVGYKDFVITPSRAGTVTTAITPDAATCQACLADMFDSSNRRYRYAFTNCTHCGPRYTITRHLPYDRPQTSMARFAMCAKCRTEYTDPLDRRFHAQPNACPVCGPHLSLLRADKTPVAGDPIDETVRALRDGAIVAVKGLGGFHLACDARNAKAIATLRLRKHRDEKPFAVMVANVASAHLFVQVNDAAQALLEGIERPIVLLSKKPGLDLPGLADALDSIGVMLPYTPLHWLLFHSFAGKPEGTRWTQDLPLSDILVMTSANPSGEPLVTGNDEAFDRLKGIADLFLIHNRDIVVGCDDSVIKPIGKSFAFIRRARGYTPRAVKLSCDIPPTLATGAFLKNTAAASRGKEAFLTQHIGELSNVATQEALRKAVSHLLSIFQIRPDLLACDAHPDFFSSRLAREIADRENVPLIPVYHHAAHVGVAMAENGRTEATLGFALDGVGLGPKNGTWGGELLLADATGFSRKAHLKEIPLVGGDTAAREPWRTGAVLLCAIGHEDRISFHYGQYPASRLIPETVQKEHLVRRTSALGRYFDGVASLLGLCDIQHEEATAAMRLEALAATRKGRILEGWSIEDSVISIDGILASILSNPDKAQAAADFHRTLAKALSQAALDAAKEIGYEGPVALTGGCAVNRLLVASVSEDLKSGGFKVLIPKDVPAGDGGLALGELWLAALAYKAGKTHYAWREN